MSEETVLTNGVGDLTQLLKNDLATLNRLREGDIVEAELIKKTTRAVFFDVGRFGTGIVRGKELSNARDIIKNMNTGDKVSAKIDQLDGDNGYIELSLSEADKERLWLQAKALEESGEIVKVKIATANSGGLVANLCDLKAFLPTSQLAAEHYPNVPDNDRQKILEELKKFIGAEMNVKVIGVNPRNNKFIISERETLVENMKDLLAGYQVGQIIEGIVTGIADFGVFVRFADNPKIEGLIHISELEHAIVDNPKEVVKINESIKMKIIDIREGKVFLSLKALKPDPWEGVAEKVKAGEEIFGTVYKYNPFGAVINLPIGVQGVIHVSEFGSLDDMKNILKIGDKHQFVVDAVKPEEKRLVLKVKK